MTIWIEGDTVGLECLTLTKTLSKNINGEDFVLKDQLARALADYDNLRKRVEIEKDFWLKFSAERVIIKLLPILDSLESALGHLKDRGLAIGIGEFKKVFYEEGLEEISPQKGDLFDPNVHEVLELVGNGKKGQVAETVLSGWRFKNGPVVRVAKVKVFK